MPDILLVSGLGRSGTTALTRILTAHGEIALGMERYKYLWTRTDDLADRADGLFTRERFFDFSDGLTNTYPGKGAWAEYYAPIEEKFDRVRYVGDKMTTVRPRRIHRHLPDAHFVFIVRDVHDVAASWDVRARNPQDKGWSARADAETAVRKWDAALGPMLWAVRNHPAQMHLVDYERFFSDPEGRSLQALLGRLGLERDASCDEEFARQHTTYAEVVSRKERTVDPEVEELIRTQVRLRKWEKLRGFAV